VKSWIVIYLPTNTQRRLYAPSAALAIAMTGWPERDCIAQEVMRETGVRT